MSWILNEHSSSLYYGNGSWGDAKHACRIICLLGIKAMIGAQDLVNKEVRSQRSDREHKAWHVSSLGNCLTGQYLERLGKQPDAPFDDRTLRVFSIGHVFEKWFLDLLEASLGEGTVERQRSLLNPELDLAGHPDAIVSVNGIERVYELKTIHSRGFWHMNREGRNGYDHHRIQLWAYLYMTGIESGSLIYLSKDDLSINEYPVFLNDPKLEADTFEILAKLNSAWRTKTPPLPITDEKDWRYRYCGFHKQCLKTLTKGTK